MLGLSIKINIVGLSFYLFMGLFNLSFAKVDILPTPKEYIILDKKAAITPDTIILTDIKPNKRLSIGIKKIKQKIKEVSNYSVSSGDYSLFNDNQTTIMIGINPTDARLKWLSGVSGSVKTEELDFGEQGYSIQYANEGRRNAFIIKASTDVGYLYGCVSLLQMIGKSKAGNGYISCMNIFDKPDYEYRMGGNLRYYYSYNRENARDLIDFLLMNKINLLWSGLSLEKHKQLVSDPEWFAGLNEYAWDRGIRIVYEGGWDLGKAPVPPGGNRNYYKYKGMIGHRGKFYSWNNDELLKKKTVRLKKMIRQLKVKGLFFHPIDTGGVSNPELWKYRDIETRRRFKNDRAAADAHIINALYTATKQVDADILFSTVVYPYWPAAIEDKKIEKWLVRLSGLIPSDIFLCMREGAPSHVEKWQSCFKQPVLVYHEQDDRQWETLRPFITPFRFAKSLLSYGKEGIYWNSKGVASGGVLGKWLDLGLAEYSWNTEVQGAQSIKYTSQIPYWKQVDDYMDPALLGFVERANKRLFEDESTFVDLRQYNISPFLMAKPQRWVTREYALNQSLKSEELLEKLDINIHLNKTEFYRSLRSYALACKSLSSVRLCIMDARKMENKNKYLLKKARNLLNDGEADFLKYVNAKRHNELDFVKLKNSVMAEIEQLEAASK